MVLNSKKRALFFSAGEQEITMNAYEEYKTIIMAKFNTATAVRARQEEVYWDVYRVISMYENLTASVNRYRGYCYRLVTVSNCNLIELSNIRAWSMGSLLCPGVWQAYPATLKLARSE